MGHGYYLYPRTGRISVPICRCLQSFCGGLVPVQHDDLGMVQANPQGRHRPVWQAGDSQHGPGSQFTAYEFCDWVTHPQQSIQLSMDGKGRAIDNIFIERLWRSVKYEHVYLFPAADGLECYRGIKEYFENYNAQRRHQGQGNQTPLTFYEQSLKQVA